MRQKTSRSTLSFALLGITTISVATLAIRDTSAINADEEAPQEIEAIGIGGGGGGGPVCGPADAPTTSCAIVANKELFITELCVVEDACRTKWTGPGLCAANTRGAWTFGTLMAHMAGLPDVDASPARLSKFVRHWLEQMQFTQVVNGFTVTGRPGVASFIADWEAVSGVGPGGVLDMRLAPFRLLAIVNRMDLRLPPGSAGYGSGNAGEGRFVFGMLQVNFSQPNNPDAWFSRPATAILEYKLPALSCQQVLDWADRWHALGAIPFGPVYNTELQKLTDDFAGLNADPSRPNGSSISQLRTNEISFNFPWELREFQLIPDDSLGLPFVPLTQTTVAQTVDLTLNGSDRLSRWVAQNELDILHDNHVIPLSFEGQPFRAGSSLNPSPAFFWQVPDFDCTETRFKFALNNCNGCHSREAGIPNFLQVNTRSIGNEAALSQFLTGNPAGVTDPTCPQPPNAGAVTRHFNDIQRRGLDLCDLLNASCGVIGIDGEESIFSTPNIAESVH